MASKSKKLEIIRRRKKAKVGKKRKATSRTNGTTKSAKALFSDK